MSQISSYLQDLFEELKKQADFQKTITKLTSTYQGAELISQLRQVILQKVQDDVKSSEQLFHFPDGILTYLEDLTKKDNKITPLVHFEGGDNKFQFECALAYSSDYTEKLFAFTNGIINPEGGMHVTGFRSALTKLINQFATSRGVFKKETDKFSYDDIKEGIRTIISVKMVDAQFTSQSKVKLGSTLARTMSDRIVTDKLGTYFEENPSVIASIITKAQLAMKARLAARAARESVLRKGVLEATSLPGKLADCSEKNPEKSEIFIVEGDSAGGSAKQGRNRNYQAILPLRGKVLNTEKATLDRIMNYEGIKNMIIAFGTGISDKFDIEKLRYHKIILMTDADVDGAHITTLLLTFLYRYMPHLIEGGHVYMARPPLYRIAWGRKVEYVYSDPEKDAILKEIQSKEPNAVIKSTFAEEEVVASDSVSEELQAVEQTAKVKTKKVNVDIQRYKGLGEMNPDQLWETTMDPQTRLLYQVTVGEAEVASRVFEELMGSDVDARKRFIEDNAVFAEVDTI